MQHSDGLCLLAHVLDMFKSQEHQQLFRLHVWLVLVLVTELVFE